MGEIKKHFTVGADDTADRVASGALKVLATPKMIAWMENTAMGVADSFCEAGETTVGIMINTEHMKASLVGEDITCTATLLSREGRKLSFGIECMNSKGEIVGKASHDRFIVDAEKFMAKIGYKA